MINVLVAALGFYWPAVTAGPARAALMTAIIATLAFINILGIRQSAWVVNSLTIGKLVPLALFIVVGLAFVDFGALSLGPLPPLTDLSTSGLLLIFAFGGYEVIPVPAGEIQGPAADRALRLDHDDRRRDRHPDAGADRRARHAAGPVDVEDAARGCRRPVHGRDRRCHPHPGRGALDAREQHGPGALGVAQPVRARGKRRGPARLARVSPRFGTPVVAIVFTAAVSLVLATTGSFVGMAAASAVSRLVVYVATCAAGAALRSPRLAGQGGACDDDGTVGTVIPVLAILIALAILAGATPTQLRAGGYALAAGAVLFVIAVGPWRKA